MRLYLAITAVFLATVACAQDPHFSQYFFTPQLYNPSLTGAFEGDIRASTHYKRQWYSAGNGYGTQALDAQWNITQPKDGGNRLSTGLFVMNDKAGKAQLQSLQILGSFGVHLKASRKDVISGGLQVGYLHRTMDFEGLAWDAQYNGYEYDPSLDDRESQYTVPMDRGMEFGAGATWRHDGKKAYVLGYSFRHLGQDQTHLQRGRDLLPIRQTLHWTWFSEGYFIHSRYELLVQRQRGAMEIAAGWRGEYRFGQDSRYTDVNRSSSIHAGIFYRWQDALSPMIGFEWKRTASCFLSYDISLGSARAVTGIAGGPEITLLYTGSFGQHRKIAN